MNPMKVLAICAVAVFLAVTIKPACAIECYACEYPGSDWCNDPFNEDNVPENGKMPCGDAQCLKAVAEITPGNKGIVRSCGSQEICEAFNLSPAAESCLLCSEDLCNGATSFASVVFLVAATIVAAIANQF